MAGKRPKKNKHYENKLFLQDIIFNQSTPNKSESKKKFPTLEILW